MPVKNKLASPSTIAGVTQRCLLEVTDFGCLTVQKLIVFVRAKLAHQGRSLTSSKAVASCYYRLLNKFGGQLDKTKLHDHFGLTTNSGPPSSPQKPAPLTRTVDLLRMAKSLAKDCGGYSVAHNLLDLLEELAR